MFNVTQMLAEQPAIVIVDVGPAHPGTPRRWQGLLDADAGRVVGLEALEKTCAQLREMASAKHTFLPLAIADGAERTLYRTAFDGCSSLYEPNQPFLLLFQNLAAPFEVIATERVRTHRLDDVDELRRSGCDFMNLDVGGAAYDVLAHGTHLLEGVMVLELRLPLTPMYRDQPMLGEIDRLLRRNGFIVHRYLQSGRGALNHPSIDGGPGTYLNQELWGDFVYVKDFAQAASQPRERWVKLAVLAHELYQAYDLAHLALRHADACSGGDLAPRYLAAYETATLERLPT